MFKKINFLKYISYGCLAAILYCLPEIFFLLKDDYRNSWLLFSGCLLFMFFVVFFLIVFNKRRKQNAASETMLVAGMLVTIFGVLVSAILSYFLMLIFIQGFSFHAGNAETLQSAPENIVKDKTGGLAFMVFMTALAGNFCAGSFASIIFSFSLKKDQTGDAVTKTQAEF